MNVHRPPTADRPTAPQDNQCLLSHFWLVWEPKRKLIAHQCCDQLTAVKTGHPLTSITWPYRELKCRPIEVEYFLKLSADKLPVSNDRRLKFIFFFQGFISNMLCLCHYGPALFGFWFETDLGSENSESFFKSTGGEDLILPWSRVGHALRPIFILWLVKIDRWVHVEKLLSLIHIWRCRRRG